MPAICQMHPTQHERSEWLRCATAAAAIGFDVIATVLRRAAAGSGPMSIHQFNACQSLYISWLIDGFSL